MPIFVPPKLDVARVSRYLEISTLSNQYSNFGPLEQMLTRRIADYLALEPENVLLVSNATAALEAALATYQPQEISYENSREWRVPSWTFAATGLAAIRSNVEFEFCDVDSQYGLIRPEIEDSVSRNLGVAPFGSGLDRLLDSRIDLIDAAASFDALRDIGAKLNNRVGVVVSLHATKSLSSGEGGFFFSKDRSWVARAKSFTTFGFDNGDRSSTRVGTNAKMSESTAALGLSSLDGWAETKSKWVDVMAQAIELSQAHNLKFFGSMSDRLISPYWTVRCKSASERDDLRVFLDRFDISSRLWWESGLHKMPAFGHIRHGSLDETERWASTYLGLPFFPDMQDYHFEKIAHALEEFRAR